MSTVICTAFVVEVGRNSAQWLVHAGAGSPRPCQRNWKRGGGLAGRDDRGSRKWYDNGTNSMQNRRRSQNLNMTGHSGKETSDRVLASCHASAFARVSFIFACFSAHFQIKLQWLCGRCCSHNQAGGNWMSLQPLPPQIATPSRL